MERTMEAEKPECGGTMKQNRSGNAIRSFPASEQLSTRSCARCAGLLVTEWYYDLHNTGADHLETLRCVQCGHRVDPVILQNQIQPSVESQQVRHVQRKYSARTGMVRDLA
jgi:C4-type Zn-finger protein